MKIAICGVGVAGGYLLSRLKAEHEVVGFERMTEQKHDSICAWGASKNPGDRKPRKEIRCHRSPSKYKRQKREPQEQKIS